MGEAKANLFIEGSEMTFERTINNVSSIFLFLTVLVLFQGNTAHAQPKTPIEAVKIFIAGYCIGKCMRQANLPSTPYWLRHTYAQNLIESGTPIFEIKEMMGHDKIESTKNYLHIHIKMMRKVLFDEEL